MTRCQAYIDIEVHYENLPLFYIACKIVGRSLSSCHLVERQRNLIEKNEKHCGVEVANEKAASEKKLKQVLFLRKFCLVDIVGTSDSKGTVMNDGILHGTSMVATKNYFDMLTVVVEENNDVELQKKVVSSGTRHCTFDGLQASSKDSAHGKEIENALDVAIVLVPIDLVNTDGSNSGFKISTMEELDVLPRDPWLQN